MDSELFRGKNMAIVFISILFVILIFVFIFVSKDSYDDEYESFSEEDNKVPFDPVPSEAAYQMCKRTTNIRDNDRDYMNTYCMDKNIPEARRANNRGLWCRMVQEHEIFEDINKDAWCNMANPSYVDEKVLDM